MRKLRKALTRAGLPIFLILTALAVLWFAGNLPFVQNGSGQAVADTTQTAAKGDDAEDSAEKNKEPEVLPVPVELAKVGNQPISAYYRAASVIEADRLVDLVCRTQGRIQLVSVEEGDMVQAGQVLAELENEREKIQLRKADLTLADKDRELERSRNMLAEEVISRQEFDDVQSAWNLAEAERDLARIALEDTRIRAPFSGLVTERKVVVGQQVTAGAAVFALGDFSPLRVRVHLPEAVARKVEKGQRVLITPEAASGPLEAVIERVSPVVDPITSTVRLTLLLADDCRRVSVGGFVKVRITTESHHQALAIPKTALVEEGALHSVFVAEADTVRNVEVETGLYDETHVEILEGLFCGDFVVTLGQGGLRTGAIVRVLNDEDVGYSACTELSGDPDSELDYASAPATKQE